jgi:hypothetical protein
VYIPIISCMNPFNCREVDDCKLFHNLYSGVFFKKTETFHVIINSLNCVHYIIIKNYANRSKWGLLKNIICVCTYLCVVTGKMFGTFMCLKIQLEMVFAYVQMIAVELAPWLGWLLTLTAKRRRRVTAIVWWFLSVRRNLPLFTGKGRFLHAWNSQLIFV